MKKTKKFLRESQRFVDTIKSKYDATLQREKEMSDSDYTYTIGIFDIYSDAKQMKSILLRSGILDAKVIPYMNDVQLNKEQVEILKDVYPDLVEFLRFEG